VRPDERERDPGGPLFWVLAVLGLAIVAFGVAGLLRNVRGPALASWAKLLAGGLVLHDGIAAPAIAVVSVVLVRLLPARLRPPLQAALVVSVLVLLVAVPVIETTGRLPGNPSLLPSHRYGANALAIVGAIWLVALAFAARAWRRGRPPA
jgi:hypothetical protein